MARDTRELKSGSAVSGVASGDAARPVPWQRTRLTTMPLAVLLPQLSDVGQITGFRGELEDRLKTLQEKAESSDSDAVSRLQVEQNMLQQVLQWLDVEAEEE